MTQQPTPKSHLHSFTLFNIIGSSIANNTSVIKTVGGRSFFFHDFCDFSINRFFRVGPWEQFQQAYLQLALFSFSMA
jgi:hypothetical protein